MWNSPIPRHLRNFQNLKNIPPSNICRHLTFLIITVTPSRAFIRFCFLIENNLQSIKNYESTFETGPTLKCFKAMAFFGIWEIWGISRMPRYLGNFPNAWVSGKFPKCLGFGEISQISSHLRTFQNLKIYHPQIPIGTWEISQMPENLGNFPNAWVSGKYPKCLGIWEIYQMPGYLGNFPNTYRYLRVVYF